MLAQGTSKSVKWTISDDGVLFFEPKKGNEGTFANSKFGEKENSYPWLQYRTSIVEVKAAGTLHMAPYSLYMFYGMNKCEKFDLSHFDTSAVINMSGMFAYVGCIKGIDNVDFSSFDTSKVQKMNAMFVNSGFRTLDLSSFDTSHVTNMAYMFRGCKFLETLNLKNWNTSKVTSMSYMFAYDVMPTLDLSSFVKNVNGCSIDCMFWQVEIKTIYAPQFALKEKQTNDAFSWFNGLSSVTFKDWKTSQI